MDEEGRGPWSNRFAFSWSARSLATACGANHAATGRQAPDQTTPTAAVTTEARFTQKTFWWSDRLSPTDGPAPITLTGRRLDGSGSFEAPGSGGASFRDDIGQFMVVGIEIPVGCWELTAGYGDAELSYVVLVEG